MTGPIEALDAAALARGYRGGAFTPRQVAEAALDRARRLDPALNAFADFMAEDVLAAADRAGAELAAGQDRGPLHGIPVAVKDLIEVAGIPTRCGSLAAPMVPEQDATLVARLRAAGAVIFGKTNLLEFAYGIPHPAIGQTNNPHDPTRTAGGSSGGSAAAVAAGIVPIAIGTDTGGSIRIPAAYCGILGLKPTRGLVPLDGVFPLSPTLDHAGPLARTAADAALSLAVLSGQPATLASLSIQGLRIGVLGAHFSQSPIGGPVSAHVRRALGRIAQAGAEVRDVDLPDLAGANAALIEILLPEAAEVHRAAIAAGAEGYGPATRARIEAGFATRAADYLAARAIRDRTTAAVEAAFAGVDVLASPAVPYVAPERDPEVEDGPDSEMTASGYANLTGHPSLSLPCGRIGHLPVGLQLTAAMGRDGLLLSVAEALAPILAETGG